MALAGLLVAAFLVGAVPFAWLAVRAVHGVDVRAQGSGNAGATNAARMWQSRRARVTAFFTIFLLDAGKGYVATGLLPGLCDRPGDAVWAAVAAVCGHAFSPFLRFRGGKGVATTIGAFLALDPVATAAALAAFVVVYVWTKMVAAGSLAFALVLPAAVALHGARPVLLLAVALALLIIVLHRDNIARMRRGREGT